MNDGISVLSGSSGRSKNDGGYVPYDAYIVSEHGTGIMIFMQ